MRQRLRHAAAPALESYPRQVELVRAVVNGLVELRVVSPHLLLCVFQGVEQLVVHLFCRAVPHERRPVVDGIGDQEVFGLLRIAVGANDFQVEFTPRFAVKMQAGHGASTTGIS